MGEAPLVLAVAALPPVAALTAAFLRCEEAAKVTRMCTAFGVEAFRDRCSLADRESQRNSDVREAALKRRARRRAVWAAWFEHGDDSEFDSESATSPSIGFSIDSDGHLTQRFDQ